VTVHGRTVWQRRFGVQPYVEGQRKKRLTQKVNRLIM
jgi:hypothetical protein